MEPTSHEVGIDVGADGLASQASQISGSIQTDGPGGHSFSQTDGPGGHRFSQTDGPGGHRFSQTDGPGGHSQAGRLSQTSQVSGVGVSVATELEAASQNSIDVEVGGIGKSSAEYVVHITSSPPHSLGEVYYVTLMTLRPTLPKDQASPTPTSHTHYLTPHRAPRDPAPLSLVVLRWLLIAPPNPPVHNQTRPTSQ